MARLPLKTAVTVFFFAALGSMVVWIDIAVLNRSVTSSAGAAYPGGPPGSTTEVVSVSDMESDLSVLVGEQPVADPHQPIEYRDKDALRRFSLDLASLAYGKRRSLLRIVHYGDSILATDELAGRVRYILQRRFGDGGEGFVLIARPWQWYHHQRVELGSPEKSWKIRPMTSAPLDDGLYGLGGVAFLAHRGMRGRAWFDVDSMEGDGDASRYGEVSYLEQPVGGSFDLLINGETVHTVSTDGKRFQLQHFKFRIPSKKSRIAIKFNGDGKLRLFGMVFETEAGGVVYDKLAINGARATILARYNPAHWIASMKRRDPSLIILMLGANEGANQSLNLQQYKIDFTEVISTIKNGLPDASCLVVGALDQAKPKPGGGLESKVMPYRLKEAQRQVALSNGCAFFDAYEAMGGKNSMAKWCTTGLGGGDFIHPTKAGAQRLGTWIAESLISAYQAHGGDR